MSRPRLTILRNFYINQIQKPTHVMILPLFSRIHSNATRTIDLQKEAKYLGTKFK